VELPPRPRLLTAWPPSPVCVVRVVLPVTLLV